MNKNFFVFLSFLSILLLYSCENDTPSEIDKLKFLISHEWTQRYPPENPYFFTKQFEKIVFTSSQKFEVIYKSPGRLHLLPRDSFIVDTISGNYFFDRDLNKITFNGTDSLVYLPGQFNNMPEGGTIYLVKADWILENISSDTIKITGIPTSNHEHVNEIDIWAGTFYFEPITGKYTTAHIKL